VRVVKAAPAVQPERGAKVASAVEQVPVVELALVVQLVLVALAVELVVELVPVVQAAPAARVAETAPTRSGCACPASSRIRTTFLETSSNSATTASTATSALSVCVSPVRTAILTTR
jgi:hypothetical protein